MWGIDRSATVDKFYGDALPENPYPLITSGMGTPYGNDPDGDGGSLYNMTDTTKNPVFKLLAKKTFQPGGLKLGINSLSTDNIDDYLTIIWSIKF